MCCCCCCCNCKNMFSLLLQVLLSCDVAVDFANTDRFAVAFVDMLSCYCFCKHLSFCCWFLVVVVMCCGCCFARHGCFVTALVAMWYCFYCQCCHVLLCLLLLLFHFLLILCWFLSCPAIIVVTGCGLFFRCCFSVVLCCYYFFCFVVVFSIVAIHCCWLCFCSYIVPVYNFCIPHFCCCWWRLFCFCVILGAMLLLLMILSRGIYNRCSGYFYWYTDFIVLFKRFNIVCIIVSFVFVQNCFSVGFIAYIYHHGDVFYI